MANLKGWSRMMDGCGNGGRERDEWKGNGRKGVVKYGGNGSD